MVKWILPLACVVALGACGQMQQDRPGSSTMPSNTGASGSMGSGSEGSSASPSSGASSMPSSGSSTGSSSGTAGPSDYPATGVPGAKAKGLDPSVPEPTTSGTTTNK